MTMNSTTQAILHTEKVPGSVNLKGRDEFPQAHECLSMDMSMIHPVSSGRSGIHQASGSLTLSSLRFIVDAGPGILGFTTCLQRGTELPQVSFVVVRQDGGKNMIAYQLNAYEAIVQSVLTNAPYDQSQQRLQDDHTRHGERTRDMRELRSQKLNTHELKIMANRVEWLYMPLSVDAEPSGSLGSSVDFVSNSLAGE